MARTALLIATDTYGDPTFQALRAPRLDATELAAVLGDPAIGGFDTRVLVNRPAQELREQVEALFADAGHDDVVLLYLSGHGVKARLGALHFVATDTRNRLLASTSVAAKFVREQIDHSLAAQVVVWLDCCYGGAFPSGMLPRSAGTVDVVQQLEEGRGCTIMTASTHIQYAYEPASGRVEDSAQPSIFTRAIIDGLRTGSADLDRDGVISARDLYGYVYDRVRRANPDQTPTSSGVLSGDLRIASAGPPLPAGLPDEVRRLLRSPDPKLREWGLRILRDQGDDPVEPALDPVVDPVDRARRTELDEQVATLLKAPLTRAAKAFAARAAQLATRQSPFRPPMPFFERGASLGEGGQNISFTADSRRVISGWRMWSVAGWGPVEGVPHGGVKAVSPDGRLAANVRVSQVFVLSTATWREMASIAARNVYGLAFNHDGSLLTARSSSGSVLWRADGDRWEEIRPFSRSGVNGVVRFSAGSARSVLVTGTETVSLWDTDSWTLLGSVTLPGVRLAEVSADGLFLAVASAERVEVWRTVDWRRIAGWGTGDGRARPLAFAPDLSTVVFQGWDGLELRDTANGEVVQRIPTRAEAAALSADGRFLAITTSRSHVWVWSRVPSDLAGRADVGALPPPPSRSAQVAHRVRFAGGVTAVAGVALPVVWPTDVVITGTIGAVLAIGGTWLVVKSRSSTT